MRILFFFCVINLSAVFAQAQKKKNVLPKNTGAIVLSSTKADSLIDISCRKIFNSAGLPSALYDKHAATIRPMVRAALRNRLQVSEESRKQIQNDSQTNDAVFAATEQAFARDGSLKRYLNPGNSDRITGFSSTVRIKQDGKLIVTEIISIFNGNGTINYLYGQDSLLQVAGYLNNDIQRGIVRSFPLSYINKLYLFQNSTFKLISLFRDGKPENYHKEKKENGIVLYTGSQAVLLDPGIHTYTITYETDHQLKNLSEFDELYWNVTGNGSSLRVDKTSCTVILPSAASVLSNHCYTGKQGSKEENCQYTMTTLGDSTVIKFMCNRPLGPTEGFTIATSWKKGYVSAMSGWKKIKYYLWNNRAVFLLPMAALFALMWGLIQWWRVGRDPRKGSVYPRFEPPSGYSPAALGYIYDQRYSGKLTTAAIVDAAVRNNIRIDVERKGKLFRRNEYKIERSDKKNTPPASNYNDFWNDLNDLVGTSIRKGKYNSALGSLNKRIKNYCETEYQLDNKKKKKGFFRINETAMAFPAFICFAAGIWAVIELMISMIRKNYFQAVYFAGGICLCWLVFRLFSKIIPAYTTSGRMIMDDIEGFRMFLSTADERRFDSMNPPTRSLALYEKYLPFAIALGCEIAWGKKFRDIIDTASIENTASFSSYSSNNHRQFSSSSFASSFSGAISSASSPPSSSSGGGSSFGGGSSGGGGGGGGVGGW